MGTGQSSRPTEMEDTNRSQTAETGRYRVSVRGEGTGLIV